MSDRVRCNRHGKTRICYEYYEPKCITGHCSIREREKKAEAEQREKNRIAKEEEKKHKNWATTPLEAIFGKE